jgi:BirA family transcriptional regulator, biotin operon repressor / biotin---[acetyl-CoA-carboxylase] ligase
MNDAGSELRIGDVEDTLATKRLGTRFYYFPELDSTNNYARALAQGGAPEGVVVIAEQQTQGRGRLARRWVSPPFVNIYCSIILRPTLPPARAAQITLTAAVALSDTLAGFSPVPPAIKWPNDILADGKKLAGVLTEAVSDSRKVDFVILGIGVNVNYTLEAMPAEIRERATSLSMLAGRTISREDFLRRLIQDLDRCYAILEEEGFAALAPQWDARFGLRGRAVRVEMTDRSITGRALGIDADGLLLVKSGGVPQRIVAGDVIPLDDEN